MNIIYKKINEIFPYENNPRNNENAVKAVASSIENFGFLVPIIIDKNGIIIAGHTRLKAAKMLQVENIPCVIADELNDAQIKSFRLIDNKVSEIATWDEEKLKIELEEIEYILETEDIDLNFEMCDFGFEVIGMDENEEKNITEDYFDIDSALKKEAISKRGDIFKLGNHRLMCGDSTSLDDIEKLVSNNKIDLIFTDPPYGISIVNKNNKVGSENIAKNKVYKKVLNDNTTETAKKACDLLFKICDKSIIWGGNYFIDFLPLSDGWIIWDKRIDMNSNNFADGEMAWCSFHTPIRIYHQLWNGMIREGEKEERIHPTQKPVRMLGEILRDFSKEKDIIIDSFGGSGSTLIACEKMKRTCFMMEYDPEYVDLIIRRWEKYTGEKAEKING